MYTNLSFAKNKYMRKSTKILLIIFILVQIPALILGKFVFAGIVPTGRGFTFNFDIKGIIGLILTLVASVLGMILFFRFIMSQSIDKAIFFSSAPLILIYGLLIFLLADLSTFDNSTARSVRTLLNISPENAYNTILWAVLITIVFVLLLFFNFFILCKPLNRVEKVVSRLGDGKVKEEKLKIGGGKQFNNIEHGLNKINNNYRSKDNTLRKVNLETQKFIPKQFFKFFGKTNVTELELGNQVKKKATTLYLKMEDIANNEQTLEERFNFLNSYMNVISPLIRKFNGFVDKYTEDGILAVFAHCEDAIDCSHAVARAINIKNRHNKSNSNISQRISIMTGEIIFGIVGEEERKMPTIISDVISSINKLDEVCRMLSAKVVFTKTSLDDLPLNYKFLYRYIGKFNVGENEVIAFEDLDVYPRDISSRMVKTKPEFERGVIAYESGDYKQASNLFSNALKIFPNDKACYLYFNKCKEKLNA